MAFNGLMFKVQDSKFSYFYSLLHKYKYI